MYTKLINKYNSINDDDYIYVVEGNTNNYVTKDMPMINTLDIYSEIPSIICEGISKDIKRSKNIKELDDINIKRRIKSR